MTHLTIKAACLVLLATLGVGCGGRSSRVQADGGAGEFCSGGPKLSLNGAAYTVKKVSGTPLAMGCCDGAYVAFDGQSSSGKSVTVTAAIKVFGASVNPGTMDLANLPSGVEVFVSYQPCAPPVCAAMYRMDSAKDIFAGSVTMTGTHYKDLRVTLCLTAQASSGDPNFSDVTLWARDVPINTL